jgi:thymidylate synthase (FAD)
VKVTCIAETHLKVHKLDDIMPSEYDVTSSDELAEFAGRACYQSFSKPNPARRDNVDYMKHILGSGHESVLEHASATFYVEGVSRALTHELIRHRHLSYSELSQRFINMEDAMAVEPPAWRKHADSEYMLGDVMDQSKQAYEIMVESLQDKGLTRKEIREAARCVLPSMTETKIVVTGNMRAWRDMLRKRYSVHADAEIREFASEILNQLRTIAPNSFQDFPSQPFGSDE